MKNKFEDVETKYVNMPFGHSDYLLKLPLVKIFLFGWGCANSMTNNEVVTCSS